MIRRGLDVGIDEEIYSDSKVVLGYIQNVSRRFYVKVANRVHLIRNATAPSPWRYIYTARNPADRATRCVTPEKLVESPWILGLEFLWNLQLQPQASLLEVPFSESDPGVKSRHLCHCNTLTPEFWLREIQALFQLVLPEARNFKSYCVHKKVQGEESAAVKKASHPSASSVCNRTRTSWQGRNQVSTQRKFPNRAKGDVISWNGEISSQNIQTCYSLIPW